MTSSIHLGLRWTVMVLLLTLSAAPARAQAVDPPVPAEGTTGAELLVTGEGLGPKLKLWLRGEAFKKPVGLKPLEFGDGFVRVLLRRAPPAGVYDLHVRPKGGEDIVLEGAFTVRAPADLALTASEALPGDFLEIRGTHLGTRRGRVTIGGRRTRVFAWEPDGGADPGADPLGTIRVRVPGAFANGQYSVAVTTHAGTTVTPTALTIVGSAKPLRGRRPYLTAQLGEQLFVAKVVGHAFDSHVPFAGGQVLVTAEALPGKSALAGTLRLRLRWPTDVWPVDLDQAAYEAHLEYEQPAPGGGTTLWRSTTCAVHVDLHHKGRVRGLFQATLLEEGGDATLPVQAGFFVSRQLEAVQFEEPSPQILTFFGSGAVDVGQPITLSWTLQDADPLLTSASLEFPAGSGDHVPVPLFGPATIVPMNGPDARVILRLHQKGVSGDLEQRVFPVGGPVLTIVKPEGEENAAHHDELFVRVSAVGSPTATVRAEASLAGATLPLEIIDGGWQGTFPLDGLPLGIHEVRFEVEDAGGLVSVVSTIFDHDEPPILTVHAPSPWTVGDPTLRVTAGATDPDGGSVRIRVQMETAHGPAGLLSEADDWLDEDIDVSGSSNIPQAFLRFLATDEAGYEVQSEAIPVVVSAASALEPVLLAPGILLDVDATGERLLFFDADADPPQVAILDVATQAVTTLPWPRTHAFVPGPLDEPALARFTPTGVLVTARALGGDSQALFVWDGLARETLANEVEQVMRLAGDYASFARTTPRVFRRRFSTATHESVPVEGTQPPAHDVDESGTLVWAAPDVGGTHLQVFLQTVDGEPTLLSSLPDKKHGEPVVSAGRVVYRRADGDWQTVLHDGRDETVLQAGLFPSSSGDYAVEGDWVVFNREGAEGQRQTVRRALDGTEDLVSPSVFDAFIEHLTADGEVTLRVGNHHRRSLSREPGDLQDLGSGIGRSMRRDGVWFVLRDRWLFSLP